MTRYATAITLILTFSSSILMASPARKGCTEGALSVLADINSTHAEDQVIASGSLGYFLTDRFELGGIVQRESVKFDSYWGYGAVYALGVFGEYELVKGSSPLTPFLGGSVQVLSETDNDNVFVFNLSPGLKLYITETFGLSAQINFSAASDDIYAFNRIDETRGTGKKTDVSATFGLRFLFF